MHRTKKAIKQLREYLGRDAQGVKLLDEIAAMVNDLRKDAATALETSQAAERIADRLKGETAELTTQVAQISDNLRHAKAKILQLQRQDAMQAKQESNAEVVKASESCESTGRITKAGFVAMFKRLVRDMPSRPRPLLVPWDSVAGSVGVELGDIKTNRYRGRSDKARKAASDRCEVYELRQLVCDYSHGQMATLGRIVALNASMGNPLVVYCSEHIADTSPGPLPERFYKRWLQWSRKCIRPVQKADMADQALWHAADANSPTWIGNR